MLKRTYLDRLINHRDTYSYDTGLLGKLYIIGIGIILQTSMIIQ